MKSLTRIILAVVIAAISGVTVAVAQEKTKPNTTKETTVPADKEKEMAVTAKWPEKDAFHSVMAATFHPMEDGDFGPARTRASELQEKAIAWQKSSAPKAFDTPEIHKTLDELVKGSTEFAELAKSEAKDDVLKEKLTALHEVFHQIVGLCKHK